MVGNQGWTISIGFAVSGLQWGKGGKGDGGKGKKNIDRRKGERRLIENMYVDS